jgi:heme O synthase-like polyprenyltransferase
MGRDLGRQMSRATQRPAPGGGLTLERATVVSWSSTGGYIVLYAGVNLSNVLVLASAGTIAAGDQVAVLRQGPSVLILGVITTP